MLPKLCEAAATEALHGAARWISLKDGRGERHGGRAYPERGRWTGGPGPPLDDVSAEQGQAMHGLCGTQATRLAVAPRNVLLFARVTGTGESWSEKSLLFVNVTTNPEAC
ncbi:hypothetical protein VTK73DRAFT_2398 [Phialemonium thermophilum]|uniref:Uncharacterized protein n=1 Tax=Phialemonium thermophilum TaxID=223376 RepID=A0ABR3VS68_9PEZI